MGMPSARTMPKTAPPETRDRQRALPLGTEVLRLELRLAPRLIPEKDREREVTLSVFSLKLVARTGFEPVISALRGLSPVPRASREADRGARCREEGVCLLLGRDAWDAGEILRILGYDGMYSGVFH